MKTRLPYFLASAAALISCSSSDEAPAGGGGRGTDGIDASSPNGAGGTQTNNPQADGATSEAANNGEAGSPPLVCPDGGAAGGFHVSPTGTSSGDGSAEAPWDLATALAQPSSVKPGATIWLHDGVYKGNFTSALAGDAANPVTVRGYPGEHPVFDGVTKPSSGVLDINGAYSIFRDFEVMSSLATRIITSTGSNPPDARGPGVSMYAAGVKLINLVVHDVGVGVGNWSPAPDGEVYGCIIFYNGWDAPDRGHGHGIYAQNETGKKYILDNIIFRQFSYGIHGYTEGGKIDNFDVEGNIVFNNGEIDNDFTTDILVGGLQIAHAPTLVDNATYFPSGEGSNNVGYGTGCTDPTLTGNYFVAATALTMENCTGTSAITGNTFIGTVSGFTQGTFPSNTYATTAPAGSHVMIRPNKYDKSRAHLAIFNWDKLDAVPVDASSVLSKGDAYQLFDAQDLFAGPVLSGVYAGGTIAVPMTHTAVTTPVGNVPATLTHTSNEFGAFLLRKGCP